MRSVETGVSPCFLATALIPWRLPSLGEVPTSQVHPGRQRYEGVWQRSRIGAGPTRAWAIVPSAAPLTAVRSRGRQRNLTGSRAIHSLPLLRPKTPAGPTTPHHEGVVDPWTVSQK
jgi:hypothetical protein